MNVCCRFDCLIPMWRKNPPHLASGVTCVIGGGAVGKAGFGLVFPIICSFWLDHQRLKYWNDLFCILKILENSKYCGLCFVILFSSVTDKTILFVLWINKPYLSDGQDPAILSDLPVSTLFQACVYFCASLCSASHVQSFWDCHFWSDSKFFTFHFG